MLLLGTTMQYILDTRNNNGTLDQVQTRTSKRRAGQRSPIEKQAGQRRQQRPMIIRGSETSRRSSPLYPWSSEHQT